MRRSISYHLLKKSRWLLLRRSENLKEEQQFPLRDFLRYNLKTVRGYLLKEAFQQLWEYDSPAWAGKFLEDWRRQTMRSRIEPVKINRPLPAHAPRTHPQLLPRSKTAFQRRRRGSEQQGQSHHEKILWLSRLSRFRTRPLSLPWQASRAGVCPRFLLTNRKWGPAAAGCSRRVGRNFKHRVPEPDF